MAFSLLILIDDIASMLDDVALMTKVAVKKTVGVVGDDLALNANQVSGVQADRELPIVWAVAKGSLLNKFILIPIALILSVWTPMLIVPLLMVGGAYLCFEGMEKLLHRYLYRHDEMQVANSEEIIDEKMKIKGAVRTDFILSAEIIIIALGEVKNVTLINKIIVLSFVGLALTVVVYGLVAVIVKMDDFGAYLSRKSSRVMQVIGMGIVQIMPWLLRILAVVGTVAMFLVGGGIFIHNWTWIHDWVHQMHWNSGIMGLMVNLALGLIIGILMCALILPLQKIAKNFFNN